MSTIHEIIQQAKTYLPNLNESRVLRAFEFADSAHSGQKRFSGEPYIIHPLNVARLLLDFHPDEDTLISALLHDVVEDTDRTLDDIEKQFGPEVRNLCWGMEKLSKVRSKLNDPQVENLRKLFLAMAKDFRVVLLKLCDRLHNMSTLMHVLPEKRERIAQETLNVYAPIAARLGIYRLKSQLEDLCFMYLHPREYEDIQNQLVKTAKWREKYIEITKVLLRETLARDGIHTKVDGRVKGVYSIYRKLRKKNKSAVDEVFDVFAMRVLLPDIYKHGKEYTGHLYTALGILHNNFTPLANRFKDYVAVPKVNGYRSLHTTVMGVGPKEYTQPTEIQLRTDSMHQNAEFGIAAHWIYEEDADSGSYEGAIAETQAPFLQQQRNWIDNLHKIEEEVKSNQELIENLQVDVFQDRIFVLTPRGDVKDLPASATPIDFAYAVHTEIGNHCIGAKVNGNMVTLDHELKSGDVVSIITRKNSRPSQHWLSFAKTNHARNRIRSWFKDLDEDKHLKEGKLLLNEKLRQLGKPILDDNLSLLRNYDNKNLSVRERQEVLIEIGKGSLFPSAAIKKIFTLEELLQSRPTTEELPLLPSVQREARSIKAAPKLTIGGEENMPHQFVKCCSAGYEDGLVGYVTRGRGVSVHKKNCIVLRQSEPNRLVHVVAVGEGLPKQTHRYPIHIRIDVEDRVGMMRDISNMIAAQSINIIHLAQQAIVNGTTALDFILEIENFDQLEKVLSNLEKIPSVRRAVKVN